MKNNTLVELNFRKLINYPNFDGYTKEKEYLCCGFCCSCIEKQIISKPDNLISISHAADSDDFTRAFKSTYGNNKGVLFIFENPGDSPNDEIGNFKTIDNAKRYIPNRIYYWIDDTQIGSPETIDELIEGKRYYAPYLYYLQKRHNLNNIYITNMTKCKHRNNNDYSKIRENCIDKFLVNEIENFNPEYIVLVGNNVTEFFEKSKKLHMFRKRKKTTILHPAQRIYTRREWVEENDRRLIELLSR